MSFAGYFLFAKVQQSTALLGGGRSPAGSGRTATIVQWQSVLLR
jgi:hypothetical protein